MVEGRIPRWVYKIWNGAEGRPLPVIPGRDAPKLKTLIQEHGEDTVAVAWALFILDKGTVWHDEPVTHVDEFTSKKGNKIVREIENQSAVTKFPLLAFLSVAEGYIVAAADSPSDHALKMVEKAKHPV